MKNKINLAVIGIAFFALLCFSYCKNEPKESAPGKAETTQTQSLEKVGAKDVVVWLRADPGGLSPYLNRSGYASRIYELLFPTLLHVDPVSLSLSPVLAKAPPGN